MAASGSAAQDYATLVALLNATQAGHSALFPMADESETPPEGDSFIELIAGGPAWRQAILGQSGSFNRDIAERDFDGSGA
ncbi:hypothetical protein [Allosphingosinicella flava]|nr:hypothetical protein [Sphingosinicella flava]